MSLKNISKMGALFVLFPLTTIDWPQVGNRPISPYWPIKFFIVGEFLARTEKMGAQWSLLESINVSLKRG